MRSALVAVAVLLGLSGCARRIDAATASRLRERPRIAFELPDEREKAFTTVKIIANVEGIAEQISAAAVVTGDRVILPELPAVTGPGWQRKEPVPEGGPLFDVRQVAAAQLLGRMERAGLAAGHASRCGDVTRCADAALILRLSTETLVLAVFGVPPQYAVEKLELATQLRTAAGETVWSDRCEVQIASRTPIDSPHYSGTLQNLLDQAAIACVDKAYARLEIQVEQAR